MASSSTSSVPKSFKYDVFLSFRGEDTRKSFTDHLYDALNRKGINTYKDDVAIRQGNVISDELIRSIEDSRFYIIVFSKRYASSSWCLDELVKIMECHKMSEHTAFPVFYDVEPREVRKQIGAVGEAFSNLQNDEAAPKWKEALNEAGRLAGRELKKTANGHEVEFIRIIIEDISKYLPSNNYCFDEKLVGMETRVKNVISYLEMDIDDVTMIGIKGIGGGGKTTLARAVYDQISYKFDGISFVENVREETKVRGLASLQKKILKNVLKDQKIKVSCVSDGINMMRMRMSSTKVLLVLDDVDDIGQLKALAGDRSWFKKGSRIIITTRDENVLHGVNWVHNVNLLSTDEAICLFSRLAFEKEVPIQGYEELSRQVVTYAGGLPLTITVLGPSLYDKNLDEWKDAIDRLKIIPLAETLQKLELSFLSLPEDRKNIFLNVACILKGWEKDLAIEALESCGFHAKIGLKDLQQKSLITIYYDYYENECVGMHDHLEEMGKNIVRRKDPEEPEKHIRLWLSKEIEDILAHDLGTRATQYMRLDLKEVNLEIVMKGIRKMQKLRFLHVYFGGQKSELDSQYLPNALQYLHWYEYPFCCLPNTFQGDNLVVLKMNMSKILRLWEGEERKVLSKLKVLDLRDSDLTIVDLGLIPNVEVLNLGGCSRLVQFHTHHGSLTLKHVDLSGSRLETVDLRSALDLEMLYLKDCYDLVKLHLPADGCLKLTQLHCTGSKLENLDLVLSANLETLNPNQNKDLVRLNMPGKCQNLRSLELTDSKLTVLNLAQTPYLEHLTLKKCFNLEELLMAEKCENLVSFNISYSFGHGRTRNLETFSGSICELRRLIKLKLEYYPEAPKNLSQLECLEELILSKTNMKHLPDDICRLKHLINLELRHCSKLENLPNDLGQLECLEHLYLLRTEIKHLPDSLCMLKTLKTLNLLGCSLLVSLPQNFGQLKDLKDLDLSLCLSLEKLPEDLDGLECLRCLILSECKSLQDIPISICKLKNLEYLDVSGTCVSHLPANMCSMKGLYIKGSRSLLESCGFTSEIQTIYDAYWVTV